MNEFFLASNRTIQKEDIEINQITVKDLDKWSQFAEPIRKELKQDYSDEKAESVIKQNKTSALMLCSLTTNFDTDVFLSIMNTDADKFISIFSEVLVVNKAYFDQEDAKKTKEKTETTWFDSFQFLISKGHRHKDILDYSFGTFLEYLKAAQRNERNSLLSFGSAMRVSYHADSKAYSKYTEEVKKG
ncbi:MULTISPECIES: hypothetical protein [Acinetobacter]|uniref:Uncharacterized protein n=1 Tax=Acinetobacter wuhouensis TaxID=1879050 RepID=A0A3G2T1U5_9GAMM|nr:MULTISPECIES: hypothetical protein [Acinetobacter]AYO54199.1 hypothetical protein CDG68_11385 [Acinetobacter wuhouensis]RZG76639.1 hypothetical protein EXE09_06290 [Acinetobacter sp. WCHAc060025]